MDWLMRTHVKAWGYLIVVVLATIGYPEPSGSGLIAQ
jgi:hypothetical protein